MSKAAAAGRAMIPPLALAQFIASYVATNMNVAISSIATDLGTDVAGVQTAITLFTLTSHRRPGRSPESPTAAGNRTCTDGAFQASRNLGPASSQATVAITSQDSPAGSGGSS